MKPIVVVDNDQVSLDCDGIIVDFDAMRNNEWEAFNFETLLTALRAEYNERIERHKDKVGAFQVEDLWKRVRNEYLRYLDNWRNSLMEEVL